MAREGDVPGVPPATFGEDVDDALVRAQDLLITAIEDYMSRRKPIPPPSAGAVRVGLPPSVALEVAVYQEMLKRGLTKAALAACRSDRRGLERAGADRPRRWPGDG